MAATPTKKIAPDILLPLLLSELAAAAEVVWIPAKKDGTHTHNHINNDGKQDCNCRAYTITTPKVAPSTTTLASSSTKGGASSPVIASKRAPISPSLSPSTSIRSSSPAKVASKRSPSSSSRSTSSGSVSVAVVPPSLSLPASVVPVAVSKKPAKAGHVPYGVANGRILPIHLMNIVCHYLSVANIARARTTCRLWRAEYAPNKSIVWTLPRQSGTYSADELKSVGDLSWLLDGAGAMGDTEHYPPMTIIDPATSTIVVSIPPSIHRVTTATSSSSSSDTKSLMSPYDLSRVGACNGLTASGARARQRLHILQVFHKWLISPDNLPTHINKWLYARRYVRWQSRLYQHGDNIHTEYHIPIGASKYGGLPDLPAHLPTPFDDILTPCDVDQNKRKRPQSDFQFLFQLNLVDYSVNGHAHNPLPRTGMLYVYYSEANYYRRSSRLMYYYYNGPMTALARWPMQRRNYFMMYGFVNNYHHNHSLRASLLAWCDIPSVPQAQDHSPASMVSFSWNVDYCGGSDDVYKQVNAGFDWRPHIDIQQASRMTSSLRITLGGHQPLATSWWDTNQAIMTIPVSWQRDDRRSLVAVSENSSTTQLYALHHQLQSHDLFNHLCATYRSPYSYGAHVDGNKQAHSSYE